MQWPPEAIDQFENIVTQLAGETHLAQPDSDEGLLPILSLANELTTELPDDPAIAAIVATIEATLNPLLEETKHFDANGIETLQQAAADLSNHLLTLKTPAEAPAEKKKTRVTKTDILDSLDDLPSFDTPEPSTQTEEPETLETFEAAIDTFEAEPAAEDAPLAVETFDLPEPEPAPIEGALLTEDQIARFETLSQQLSGELLLAEKGSDDGLLPLFSLLSELDNEFAETEFLSPSIQPVFKQVEQLVDTAQPFDDATLATLTEFNFWLESTRASLRDGIVPNPFETEENQPAAPQVESLATEPASEPEPADADNEFSEFDVVMDLNLEENQELLVEFHIEAVDHLGQIETAVLELEQDVSNQDAIDSMFRSFHTIKGVAGFLNLVPVNRLAHEIESLMDLVRNDQLPVFTGVVDLVLDAKDTIAQLIEQISDALSNGTLPTEAIPVSPLMLRARWAMEGPEAYAAKTGTSTNANQTAGSTAKPDSPNSPESGPATASRKKKATENAAIRVNTTKLDNLMDTVGELVIVQSQLQETTQRHANDANALQRNMAQLSRITKELQHTSMSLRMIPIKSTFQKMGRLVRDISSKSGKKVAFEVSGEDTELDRNVVEEIGDPLVHMVRNALDHGLETPAERLQAGKNETGRIALNAYHKGSNIVIELSDDGGGINSERVLAKAVSNGIVRPDEQLPEEEIFKLIFAAGFSTAEEITDISGRGVGMDVVRKNIEKLRGKIEIESTLGQGSTFKILLPLTMAIVDGLVVKVGKDRFILPTTSVKVALRPDEETLAKVQGAQEILNIRGKVFPLFRLHNHFQIPDAETDAQKGTVVIVENGGKQCGLLVDDMVSKQEVVIKSLGSMMQGIPGVSGGAILGDGNIALILDTASLISAA